METSKKRALGSYSIFVYPIWFATLVAVVLYFEDARRDNWASAIGFENVVPYEQVVAGHMTIMIQFLVSFVGLVLVPFVWHYCVSRERKKYPERYRKY